MKHAGRKRAIALLLAAVLALVMAGASAAAASVDASFWKSSKNFNESNIAVLAASEAQLTRYNDSDDESMEAFVVSNKVSGSGTTMIVRPAEQTSAYFTAFLISAKLSEAFYEAGGTTVRCEVSGLAVERSASKYPTLENYTMIRRWDSEMRGSVSEIFTVLSVSVADGDDEQVSHPFSLRFSIDGNYKASDLQLITSDDGDIVEVDTTLRVSKSASGKQYYVRTGMLKDGTYCVVKKSK